MEFMANNFLQECDRKVCGLLHSIQHQKIHQSYKHKYFVRKVTVIIENCNFTIVKWSLCQTIFYRNVIEACGLFHSIQHQKIHQIYKHKYFVRKVRAIIVTLAILQL